MFLYNSSLRYNIQSIDFISLKAYTATFQYVYRVCIRHRGQFLREKPCACEQPLPSHPRPAQGSRESTLSPWSCLLWTRRTRGLTQCVIIRTFYLSISFLRFTHVVACITSFPFIAEECKSEYKCLITGIIGKYFCLFRGCLFTF